MIGSDLESGVQRNRAFPERETEEKREEGWFF